MFEDGQSVFFGADKDGDLDLYVTSGSNEVRDNSLYQDRLYLNNGQGEFTKSSGLPSILSNTQSVASLDADQDGDQDLVVGATLMPKKFPFCFESSSELLVV